MPSNTKRMNESPAALRMPEFTDDFRRIETPTDPRAVALLEFWRNRPKDGLIVGRDIPSRSVASLLTNFGVFEPLVEGGEDSRVVLAGESFKLRFGHDIKGMLASELFPPDHLRHHAAAFYESVRTQKPVVLESRLTNNVVDKLHFEVVIMPVLAPDRAKIWALVAFFYLDAAHAAEPA